ncbi:hypothetical protein NQ318_017101, partial [Aromia moschata]
MGLLFKSLKGILKVFFEWFLRCWEIKSFQETIFYTVCVHQTLAIYEKGQVEVRRQRSSNDVHIEGSEEIRSDLSPHTQTERPTGLSSELRVGKVPPDTVLFKLAATRLQCAGSSISS